MLARRWFERSRFQTIRLAVFATTGIAALLFGAWLVVNRQERLARASAADTPVPSEPQKSSPTQHHRHPLDPLQPDEIERAVETIRAEKKLAPSVRFVSVALREPEKSVVLNAESTPPREARMVLLDNADGLGYEATVNITDKTVSRFEALPAGVQPSIMLDEFSECEEAAKKSPEFRAALKKRGIEDMNKVWVDAWSAGYYGNEPESDKGKRYTRSLIWVKTSERDNGYAHPVEGLVVIVDLNKKEVVRVEDHGVVPIPPASGNWGRADIAKTRTDVKPLDVIQSDGPSFSVEGQKVDWQKWSLRLGFNPREGLTLNTVSYDGRPIIYRGSIAEMVVPYGDPKESSYRKNAFDLGEYGVGMFANSLAIGCDCLGTIRYFDAHMADNKGRPVTIKNAICLHEEDYGLLWKHTDWRSNQIETRRSRRLAVSMIANVGNYDYGFYWYFYQDGSIQMEVKLTGIVNTMGLQPGESPKYGTEIAPLLYAPFHQHFFNARLDLDVDGTENSALEVNTVSIPQGPENPYGNAFWTETTPLTKESIAQRNTNASTIRFWKVINQGVNNALGRPVGYRLCPGENAPPHALPTSAYINRAGFLLNNLWVTPYQADERHPAGEYPNQHTGGDGLPSWTKADRDLAHKDLVVWYTFGHTHIPRPEDWPVMPVAALGFTLKPDGFFTQNPALDLPPSDH